MSETYRIFGSELSGYSVKVRSYFRYKGLPHEWILRSPATQAEFQKYAKLPLVPLVVTPEGEGIQDSTPIIERFEAASPSLHARRSDARLHLRAARGVRRRVGQQVDVPLSLDLSRRLLGDGRAHRRADDGRAGHACRRAGARRRGRAHERTAGLRRLQSDDAAADRGLVQARAGDPRRASRVAAVRAGRPAGDGRLRPVGPALRGGDRSDAGRADAGVVAQRDGMGGAHDVAQGRGRVRELVGAVGRPDAAAHGRGWAPVPALVHCQRGGDREGREELFDDPRRIDLVAGAAEVPRPLAAGDPPQVRRRQRRCRARRYPGEGRLPRALRGAAA